MKRRLIVVPIIKRPDGSILLIKMARHRGVFPGEWGLPGGGVEGNETIEEALYREVREELALELESATPLYFKAEELSKLYPDGITESMYMVFLIYSCEVKNVDPKINEEFDSYAWVRPSELATYDLNAATLLTLRQTGLLAMTESVPTPSSRRVE